MFKKLLIKIALFFPLLYNGCWAEDPDCCSNGCRFELVPRCVPLFRPFAADPRQVTFSVGWRFGDQLFNPHTAPVSYGNHFGVFRLNDPWGYRGALQLEIEGAIWALFEHTDHTAPLVNTDYYVGIPLVYSTGDWKFRLRWWHLSSHIGDEYLLEHPGFDRKNASAEYLDYFISYEPSWCLRLYAGFGAILRSDSSFKCKSFYAEYGGEWRISQWNTYFRQSCLWGRPFVAAHFRTREDNDYDFDGTLAFGYEWEKCGCWPKRIRLFGEYHNGFSVEGQFSRQYTDYVSLRISYGY
ncbi:MAG: hypothetical protein Tsb0021_07680 [Chlamydiales bacterium]